MLKELCSPNWEKNYSSGNAKFIACKPSSPFSHATAQNNAQSNISPIKGGGVVVLTKKGVPIEYAHDESFTDCGSEDCLSKKGFWGVRMLKGTQPYWVIATHAQAYEGTSNVNIRLNQVTLYILSSTMTIRLNHFHYRILVSPNEGVCRQRY